MKLVYWACRCLDDSSAYNIRERTMKEALKKRDEYNKGGGMSYGPVTKVEVDYHGGAFGLMQALMGEGGAESLLPENEEQAKIYRDLARQEREKARAEKRAAQARGTEVVNWIGSLVERSRQRPA